MKIADLTFVSHFVPVFLTVIMIATAQDTMDELKTRMKTRYAELREMKNSGKIGEDPMGFLAPVNASAQDAAVSNVVAAENADRSKLYTLIAKESSTTAEEVGKTNAKRTFGKAQGTDYFKAADGSWMQKKDMAIP